MLYLLNHLYIKVVYEWLMVTRDQQCESRKKISYHTRPEKEIYGTFFEEIENVAKQFGL